MERKLSVGETLGEAFSIYRSQAGGAAAGCLLAVSRGGDPRSRDRRKRRPPRRRPPHPCPRLPLPGDGRRPGARRLATAAATTRSAELMRSVLPVLMPLVGAGIPDRDRHRLRLPSPGRPRSLPADDLGRHRTGDRGRAPRSLRGAGALAPARPRQRLAGPRHLPRRDPVRPRRHRRPHRGRQRDQRRPDPRRRLLRPRLHRHRADRGPGRLGPLLPPAGAEEAGASSASAAAESPPVAS